MPRRQADDKQHQWHQHRAHGQKLETVTSFKYLGSVITDEGSKPEILSSIAQATAALTRLKPVWIDKGISLSSKIQLMHSLVTSIFLHACESWSLKAELQRRIQVMEMRCYCKILHISYKDHVTNEEVHAKIQQAIGPHEDLLTIVKRRKLQWLVMFPIPQVWPKPSRKKRRQTEEEAGRQHQGMDRHGVQHIPEGSGEQGKMEKTGCKIICGAQTTLAVKGLMMMMMTGRRQCVLQHQSSSQSFMVLPKGGNIS